MSENNTNGSHIRRTIIEEETRPFVSDSSRSEQTPDKSRQNGNSGNSTPKDSGKRKTDDETNTSTKKQRRSDQARRMSPRLDSIATVGTNLGGTDSTKSTPTGKAGNKTSTRSMQQEDIVRQFVELPPVQECAKDLPQLTNSEKNELERYLDFGADESWKDDWMGSLAFADKEIQNPDGKSRERSKKSLFRWAGRGKLSRKLLYNLIRLVYNLKETPTQAKNILGNANSELGVSIQEAVRRVFYDPIVLQQDGWTTAKSDEPIGSSGGPHRIGERVVWQGHEGVVIAYVYDPDIGDLWKAMWLEEFDTFDLEVEELEDAKRRFERKLKLKEQQTGSAVAGVPQNKPVSSSTKQDPGAERRSGRHASADFQVKGIEHGIILAVSYGRGARPGVFWPARVIHFSEMQAAGTQKRSGSKQKIDVVFLAPYWNAFNALTGNRRLESFSDSLQRHGSSLFSSGPLFEIESIDVSPESIQEYPYDPDRGLDMDELSTSFKFAGLPNAAFDRFVASHRLALALKSYSQKVLRSTAATEIDKTTAGLFEAHPLAGQTACFPDAVLHLPFSYILSQLPPIENSNGPLPLGEHNEEPALQLGVVLEAMKPPACWGQGESNMHEANQTHGTTHSPKPFASPSVASSFESTPQDGAVTVDRFISGLKHLSPLLKNETEPMTNLLTQNLGQLLAQVPADVNELRTLPVEGKQARLRALVKLWIVVKTHGEDLISYSNSHELEVCLSDWRRACERIYNYIAVSFSCQGFGNGVSSILSDAVCNLHVTSNECFERAVRLPAAMKAAKQAAAEYEDRINILSTVKKKYLEKAEKDVIKRAHSKSYLSRIKKKCQSVAKEGEVIALTEDSDGKGGEDTKGSKGSWRAAIAAVGASIQGVDMVMYGECVNLFCLTRPPGHHAGRELHAMKAVSNGFCLLNSVACAALYATSPVSEGGPGLRRVCVIDIDVHHGNGTQNILCSTYDPRFLYVSIHAGGVDVNGIDPSGEDAGEFSHHLARSAKSGIYPGRCGDTSPHQGVLNIPLGAKVTSHALGVALVTKVTPAVEKFSPELIIVSAGFDAHKNDPLGLGGLSATDFGTLTEVICKLAHKSCSGRVLSVLEGGYGVPCCRLPSNLFDPEEAKRRIQDDQSMSTENDTSIPKEGTLSKNDPVLENTNLTNHLTSSPVPTTNKPHSSDAQSVDSVGKEPVEKDTTPVPKEESSASGVFLKPEPQSKPLEILDLGDEMPGTMTDDMPYALMKRLDKCHAEGFIECVREHVATLAKCNLRT